VTPTPVQATASRSFPWWLLALAALPFLAAAAVVGGKAARRAGRLRRRDARALATGVRSELVAALVDRGAFVEPAATTTELRRSTERVFRLPAGALVDALAEARFGPGEGARAAAVRARTELGRVLDVVRAREAPAARLRAALSLRSLTRSAR
jgi:hypothetical protein